MELKPFSSELDPETQDWKDRLQKLLKEAEEKQLNVHFQMSVVYGKDLDSLADASCAIYGETKCVGFSMSVQSTELPIITELMAKTIVLRRLAREAFKAEDNGLEN